MSFRVDTYRQHVVVDTNAGGLQRSGVFQQESSTHEITRPHPVVGGLTHRPEEVHVVGRGIGCSIAAPHPCRHRRDDTDAHVLLRHPYIARPVNQLPIEIVALDGCHTCLGREVHLLSRLWVVDEETVSYGGNPYSPILICSHHIGQYAPFPKQLPAEHIECVNLVALLVDIIDIDVVVADVGVAGVVLIDPSFRHLQVVDTHFSCVGRECVGGGIGDDQQPLVVHSRQSSDSVAGRPCRKGRDVGM